MRKQTFVQRFERDSRQHWNLSCGIVMFLVAGSTLTACAPEDAKISAAPALISTSFKSESLQPGDGTRTGTALAPEQLQRGNKLWTSYVAHTYQNALEDNATIGIGIKPCRLGNVGCDFLIQYVDRHNLSGRSAQENSGPRGAKDIVTADAFIINPTESFASFMVDEWPPNESIDPHSCRAKLSGADGGPVGMDFDFSDKYWSGFNDATVNSQNINCGFSDANGETKWLSSYQNSTSARRAAVCACPPWSDGKSRCSIASQVNPDFDFGLALFDTINQQDVEFTLTVTCGNVSSSATVVAMANEPNTNGQCNATGTQPPTALYVDRDGDGAYEVTPLPEGTPYPDVSQELGRICLPLPIYTKPSDGKISFAAVEGDCDDTNPDISPFTLNSDCSAEPKKSDDAYTVWLEQTLQATFSPEEAEVLLRSLAPSYYAPAQPKISGLASSELNKPTREVPYLTSPTEIASAQPELIGNFDLNGDGYGDFAIGYPSYSANGNSKLGRVYIVAGGPSHRAGGMALELANLGHDVNKDGMISLNTLAERAVWILTGGFSYGEAGRSMVTGDFDGDGHRDLAIGQPGGNGCASTGSAEAPRVTILFGNSPLPYGEYTLTDLATLNSKSQRVNAVYSAGPDSSHALCGHFSGRLAAGDINADGKDELSVGASGEGGIYTPGGTGADGQALRNGKVYVISGSKLSSLSSGSSSAVGSVASLYMEGAGATTVGGHGPIGAGVLTLLDSNGDTKDDLVMVAPQGVNASSVQVGQVLVYDGSKMTTLLNSSNNSLYATTPSWIWNGQSAGALTDASLAVLPDVMDGTKSSTSIYNGDELVIGAYGQSANVGMVYMLFSRPFSGSQTIVLPAADHATCKSQNILCFSDALYGGDGTKAIKLGYSVAAGYGPILRKNGPRERWLVMSALEFSNGTNSTGRVSFMAAHPDLPWYPGLNDTGWKDAKISSYNAGWQDIVISDALWFGYKVSLIGDLDHEERNVGTAYPFEPRAPELLINASYALWADKTDQTSGDASSLGQVSYLFPGARGPWCQNPSATNYQKECVTGQ